MSTEYSEEKRINSSSTENLLTAQALEYSSHWTRTTAYKSNSRRDTFCSQSSHLMMGESRKAHSAADFSLPVFLSHHGLSSVCPDQPIMASYTSTTVPKKTWLMLPRRCVATVTARFVILAGRPRRQTS